MRTIQHVLLCCSGGKDSCLNLLHCIAEGHELVALANLRPADKGSRYVDISVKADEMFSCILCWSIVT